MNRRLSSHLRDVWEGLRSQPGRVGLAFAAIAIGMSSLVVLCAILTGLQERSRGIVEDFGVNVLGIFPPPSSTGGSRASLSERHASILSENLPRCYVSTVRRYQVPTLGTNELLSVVATDSLLARVRQWTSLDGRFLDEWDLRSGERNAVVSRSLSKRWGWTVGDSIMLRTTPFKIVGIVAIGGGQAPADRGDSDRIFGERVVFVPKTVEPYWASTERRRARDLDAIYLLAPSPLNFADVVLTARRLVSQVERGSDGVSLITPDSLIQGVKKLQKTIGLSVGSVALLSLVLGGTTLMSLMVSNVRERITEIGLRRALGASAWDVASLFVTEASLVAGGAAIVATVGTHLLLMAARPAFPVPLSLGLASLSIPLAVALVLGISFSYGPAKWGAAITPSEALRNE